MCEVKLSGALFLHLLLFYLCRCLYLYICLQLERFTGFHDGRWIANDEVWFEDGAFWRSQIIFANDTHFER